MLNKLLLLLVMVISVLVVNRRTSQADDAWLFTPSAGYHWADSALKLDSAPQAGVRMAYSPLGTTVADSLELEGEIEYLSTKRTDGAREKADAYLARVSALYPFLPRKQIVPYLAVGGGALLVSSSRGDDANPLLSYGMTVRYYVAEWMALGGDLRHTLVYRDGFKSDFEAGVGLTFVVGGTQKFKRIPTPKTKVPSRPGPAIKRLDELNLYDNKKIEGPGE